MGHPQAECEYESFRKARISENKARMASLNLNRCADELRSIVSSPKSSTRSTNSPWKKKVKGLGSLRRSDRLKGKPAVVQLPLDRDSSDPAPKTRLAMPAWRRMGLVSRGGSARGSVYDSVLGICCHFCRQKKLCGEEDCNRCNTGNINQPCTGKTECSVCHSSNGILCRACLKVRYGEDMEEVRRMKDWMCPHCIEEKGNKPYWICNSSSLCLKKRKMTPTGIAIYHARERGYKSVAHLLMDELKKAGKEFKN
ncbi:hypothetical protein IEQ34_015769 [Dendrobium chrysotoxum]|uniref:Zinc-finger domain-containing protein n=1 Tax=Dendrobium chrysotoxum TaxID=161865 RepID=A0AAV7GII7_DENCH|nr:hypothetical protein IEQ34_015769 [Dendrobium chrysotoxum]